MKIYSKVVLPLLEAYVTEDIFEKIDCDIKSLTKPSNMFLLNFPACYHLGHRYSCTITTNSPWWIALWEGFYS